MRETLSVSPRGLAPRTWWLTPTRLFWIWLIARSTVWTIVPALVNQNLPLDLIESVAWGHEWQLGYDKHPPLSAWLPELVLELGGGDAGIYLLAQLFVGAALWATWRLANDLTTPWRALMSVFVLEGIWYYGYTSPEFNANIVQLPFWSLAFWAFWRATERDRIGYWLLLGASVGLGFLGKYLALMMTPAMVAYLLLEKDRWYLFKRPGPYLAVATASLVVAPHLWWLFHNQFVTISYGLRRAGMAEDSNPLMIRLVQPGNFLLGQMLCLPFILGIYATFGWLTIRKHRPPRKVMRYVLLIALGPVATMMLISVVMGMKLLAMWGAPMLLPMGLLAVCCLRIKPGARRLRLGLATVAALFIIPATMYLITTLAGVHKRTTFDGRELAQAVDKQWRERFGRPLTYVIGSEWTAGNVGRYSPQRPAVILGGLRERSLWLDEADLALHGAALVWLEGRESPLFANLLELRKRYIIEKGEPVDLVEGGRVQVMWLLPKDKVPPDRE